METDEKSTFDSLNDHQETATPVESTGEPTENSSLSSESDELSADSLSDDSTPENENKSADLTAENTNETPENTVDSNKKDQVDTPELAASDKTDEESSEEEEFEKIEIDSSNPNMRWYIVNCYSGYEKRVKKALQDEIGRKGHEEHFCNIVIPQEKVVELVRGKKKSSERRFFPGYMLVQMILNNETWHTVNNVPRVTGFVGNSNKPSPLPKSEVKKIIGQMNAGANSAKPKYSFKEGDQVKVIDGPFSNFNGSVEEVMPAKSKLRVLVSIFGRATPVELDYIQVKRV